MAGLNEEARIPVYIDDEQAISALRNLQSEAARLRGVMADALQAKDMKGWDEADKKLKRVNKEMDQLKKEAFDVDKIMGKLASASVSDLEKALRKVTREWKAANQGSKEAIELDKKRTALQGRLNEVNGKIVQQQSSLSKLKDMAAGLLPAFGWAAIGTGAVMAFKKIVSATDDLSTKWEIFTTGLREGMNAFWRTIATGDWSNFFTNIESAIRVGREYAAVLDDLEAKQRTMTVAEADALKEKRDLLEKVRNAELSRDDRIKAGEDLIALEERLAGMRTKIAQEGYDNEMSLAMNASKLSKERIEELIRDFDSGMKAKAEAYNEASAALKKLDETEAEVSAMSRGNNVQLVSSEKRIAFKKVIDSTDEATKRYAADLIKLNNATDNLLDKSVAAYKGVKEAENSAFENTSRVRTQVHSMTAQEIKDQEKFSDVIRVNIVDVTDAAKQEAEALKIMKENLEEAERLMLEGGEEEFRRLVENTEAYAEILSRERENIAIASEPIDLNFATADQMQAAFDARMALIEEEYSRERQAAMGNHAALLAAESNYNKNIYDLKSDMINGEFSVAEKRIGAAQSYISALSGIVNEESTLGRALFLYNQGLAVADVWVNIAKANAKAIAASPLTLGQPWVTANTAQGFVQTGLIAGQTVARFIKGKRDGGYADYDRSDDTVAGVYHANEFIASAPAVRNPTVKPVLDLIDMAQRSGRIANLNLPAALGMRSRRSGGYAESSGLRAQSTGPVPSGSAGMFTDPRLIRAIERMNEHLDKGIEANLYYRKFEEFDKEVKDIRYAANM